MWPESASEWLTSISLFIGLVVTVGGALGKWLNNKLNAATKRLDKDIDGLSTRIDNELRDRLEDFRELELRAATHKALIDSQAFEIQGINHYQRGHEKETAELKEMIRHIAKAVEDQRNIHSQDIRSIGENVAAIKTTVRLLLKKDSLE